MMIGWKPTVNAGGAVPEMQGLKRPPCAEKKKKSRNAGTDFRQTKH
jgi:hypothetical protein